MSFCAICFAKVPHHQGTGLLLHDAARGSSSRQPVSYQSSIPVFVLGGGEGVTISSNWYNV